jgi:hypothetical protein
MSAQPSEEEEDFVQETSEAALIAAQAYLLTTQPEPGDPREHMHQATIQSLGLIEDKLIGKCPEEKDKLYKERQKEEFKRKTARNESSESSEEERRQKRKEDARNIIAQVRVNKSRHAWKEENYEDNEKEMGALCFTRRVRKMRVPKGFKLCHGNLETVAMGRLIGGARRWRRGARLGIMPTETPWFTQVRGPSHWR